MTSAIATHQLTKRYGTARGVEALDLEVPAGEVFGFLGPNGAGKSTTIRTLLDFQHPTSGTAEVLGLDSVSQSVEIRRRVGYLPGDVHLFDHLTGAAHLAWFDEARGPHDAEVVTSMVERFEISMDRRIGDLSKGNRQKVGLLLAFAHRPELLVLDEPTSGLDPLVQAEFDQLLRETTAEGRTVLLSSHSLDEVQPGGPTEVAIIRDGRLVVSDTCRRATPRRRPRLMSLRLARPTEPSRFLALDGVVAATARDEWIDLRFEGDLQPALALALEIGVDDLTARHADLDELFLSYYQADAEEES
ncbi:MAG: ABC transporter ATP-binding protein [Acidimicrobiales bacterium]